MPESSPTRIDFGDNLAGLGGLRQPSGTLEIDAFGVVQAQLTFALDSSNTNIATNIEYYKNGVLHPDSTDLGFNLWSYRYHITSSKGGVSMITVDYLGIARESGHSDSQIHGVINTTAQPIETHPNFTVKPDPEEGNTYDNGPLAGYSDDVASQKNNAMWGDEDAQGNRPFRGFGITKKDQDINKKAGIRQYLRCMQTIRGVMYFSGSEAQNTVKLLCENVGCYMNNLDTQILAEPNNIYPQIVNGQFWLMTAANVECIGTPTSSGHFAALKVTYDLMHGGEDGWDKDIYIEGPEIF